MNWANWGNENGLGVKAGSNLLSLYFILKAMDNPGRALGRETICKIYDFEECIENGLQRDRKVDTMVRRLLK